MARVIIFVIAITGFILLVNGFAANVEEPNTTSAASETPTTTAKPRPRVESVTMVDFYMRDGNTVSGRLLRDDSTQLLVEQPSGSTVTTITYSKRDVDTRTIKTRPVPEWQYYVRLAEYFTAKTWDFIDDPDDFIEAIRCYEKAKQSLLNMGDKEKAAEMDRLIKKVQDDRDVWTREVESRAKLKKLEFEAEAENRMKKLEASVAENNAKLAEAIKSVNKTADGLKSEFASINKSIGDMNQDLVKQINAIQARLNEHESYINNMWVRLDLLSRK